MSKRFFIFFLLLLIPVFFPAAKAQDAKPVYKGLLWEISGNGLKKPSYLYGTMHVSSRVAFHLSDSFFIALDNVDVVGLETRPDSWLSDMLNSEMMSDVLNGALSGDMYGSNNNATDFRFVPPAYDPEKIKASLASDPQLINSFLYRFSGVRDNFEEDTYLDLYIFQTAKKLGKNVVGVENFKEMLEFLKKSTEPDPDRSTYDNYINEPFLLNKIEDAYRRGDLDLLDSLNNLNSTKNFREYMLLRRNEKMVLCMDSILKKQTLFTGVGAAHLPGDRGVIDLLRKKGYTLRPVENHGRSQKMKEKHDKAKYTLQYQDFQSTDGMITAKVPGKMNEFPEISGSQTFIYPEMVNGAYYTIARIKTLNSFHFQTEKEISARIDSLLFENIPGKLLKTKEITRNGYPGFDITNKTRRGDYQRYQVIVTPFEVIIFKLGGTGDFAKGKDGDLFFNSIQLKPATATIAMAPFTPTSGGFSVLLPHTPLDNQNRTTINIGAAQRREYAASDAQSGNNYLLLIQQVAYSYDMIEEDSFTLDDAAESLLNTGNLSEVSRTLTEKDGRTWLELVCTYDQHPGKMLEARFVVKAGAVYALVCNYEKDQEKAETGKNSFFNSFAFTPYVYGEFSEFKDTTGWFSVKALVAPKNIDYTMYYGNYNQEATEFEWVAKTLEIRSNATGEVVNVYFSKPARYFSVADSATYWKDIYSSLYGDSSYVVISCSNSQKDGYTQVDMVCGDTGSYRQVQVRQILKHGAIYYLSADIDGKTGPSAFVSTVFGSFAPADTLLGSDPFGKKAVTLFHKDLQGDSTSRARALAGKYLLSFDSADVPLLISLIDTFHQGEDTKLFLVRSLGGIKHPALLPYLEKLYLASDDSTSLQVAILTTVLEQKTAESRRIFKKLLFHDTPIPAASYELTGMFSALRDSLLLAPPLFPDLLKLAVLNEYRENIYELLGTLADSNLVKPAVYQSYVGPLVSEAKIELKRQLTSEQQENNSENAYGASPSSILDSYVSLLMPFYGTDDNARQFIQRSLYVKNDYIREKTALLLLAGKQPVPDSVFTSLVQKRESRLSLYNALKAAGREARFPKAWHNQDSMVKAILLYEIPNSYVYAADSIVLLEKQPLVYKQDTGFVYFFRIKKRYDATWEIVTCGVQPADTSVFNTATALTGNTNILYNPQQPLGPQLAKALKSIKKIKRREKYTGYEEYTEAIAF